METPRKPTEAVCVGMKEDTRDFPCLIFRLYHHNPVKLRTAETFDRLMTKRTRITETGKGRLKRQKNSDYLVWQYVIMFRVSSGNSCQIPHN